MHYLGNENRLVEMVASCLNRIEDNYHNGILNYKKWHSCARQYNLPPSSPSFVFEGHSGIPAPEAQLSSSAATAEDNDNSHPLERAKWLGLRVVDDAPRNKVTTTPVRLSWEKNRATNIHPEARAMDVPLFFSKGRLPL